MLPQVQSVPLVISIAWFIFTDALTSSKFGLIFIGPGENLFAHPAAFYLNDAACFFGPSDSIFDRICSPDLIRTPYAAPAMRYVCSAFVRSIISRTLGSDNLKLFEPARDNTLVF